MDSVGIFRNSSEMNRQLIGGAMTTTPVGVARYPCFTLAFVCKEDETVIWGQGSLPLFCF
jgi:hypothetical protein